MDIRYNGIQFAIVKTNEISFTPVWSEDGTTYLYTRVNIDIEGVMNPEAMAYILDGSNDPQLQPGAFPASTIDAVRHYLMQPRAALLVSTATGDSFSPTLDVIESPAPGMPCDLNNGPKPRHCRVYNYSGARTWYISWSCETWIRECPNEDQLGSPLLSNRYSREDQIDEQFKSTIVTSGVAVFRTDILENANAVADDFRYAVLPPVPFGFQRRRISVVAVPNRNALRWSCTDEERMYDLGDTSATGSYIVDVQGTYGASSLETAEGIPGGQSLGQFFVRVRGTKQASNWILTQRCFAFAAVKLPIGQPQLGYIRHVSVTQSLVDRDVSLNIVYMFTPENQAMIGAVALISLRIDSVFADQGGRNPSPPWGQGTQGTSGLGLLVAALEDACSGASSPPCPEEGPVDGGAEQCGPEPVISVTTSDELEIYDTQYETNEPYNSYNTYDMKTRYYRSSNILQAPIAGSSQSSSNSSGSFTSGEGVPSASLSSQGNAPTAAFFRLANPTSTVVVTWRAERVGRSPLIPDPNSSNSNYVLLDMEITPSGAQVCADGVTYIFAISGKYTFGCITAMGTNEKLGFGVVPWVAGSFTEAFIAPEDYTQGLIDEAGGSTGENFA